MGRAFAQHDLLRNVGDWKGERELTALAGDTLNTYLAAMHGFDDLFDQIESQTGAFGEFFVLHDPIKFVEEMRNGVGRDTDAGVGNGGMQEPGMGIQVLGNGDSSLIGSVLNGVAQKIKQYLMNHVLVGKDGGTAGEGWGKLTESHLFGVGLWSNDIKGVFNQFGKVNVFTLNFNHT